MRAVTLLLFAVSLLLAQDGQEEFVPGKTRALRWRDLEKVIKSARKNYKPVLIYVYSKDHLELCKQIEKILAESPVRLATSKFLCIKIDGDDKDTWDFRKDIGLKKEDAGLFLCDCLFRIRERYQGRTSLDDPKEFARHLKEFDKEHKKFVKKLKVLDKVWEKAEWARKKRRWRDYYGLLEEVKKLAANVEGDKRGEQAQQEIENALKEGNRILNEAEKLVQQVERSLRWGGTRNFRQDLVYSAQQKLMKVSSRYPLKELSQRAARISARLTAVCQEYQKQVQQQQQKNKK